jgi:LysR family transcriptional regulator, hydrogen peroxide-inducible genes activator
MEIRQLRYFCAVVETGSFTRGARRERVSQPSLSEQIKLLEAELELELFDRLGQTTKLTAAGRTFYRTVRPILKRLAEVKTKMQDAQNLLGGSVTIGAAASIAPYFLPPALVSFKRKFPLIRLKIVEESSDQLLQDLRNANVDLAILQPPVSGGEFACEQLLDEPLYLVLPARHRLASRKIIQLQDLKEDAFLVLRDGNFRKVMLDVLRKARVRPKIVGEVQGLTTILMLVSAGLGVSVMPQMAIERRNGCKVIALHDEPRTRAIALVRLKSHNISHAQRLLAEHLHRFANSQMR